MLWRRVRGDVAAFDVDNSVETQVAATPRRRRASTENAVAKRFPLGRRAARPPVLRVAVPPQTAREVQFFGEDRVREVRDEVRRALELRPIGAGGAREALRRLDAARGAALVDAPAAHYY